MFPISPNTLVALLIGLAFLFSDVVADQNVTVDLQLSSASICVCDPIFVKLTITNRGASEIKCDERLNSFTGRLQWTVRFNGGKEKSFHTRWSGLDCGLRTINEDRWWLKLPPQSEYQLHEVVFLQNSAGKPLSFVFEEPGTYHLVADIWTGERKLQSRATEITVAPKNDSHKQYLNSRRSFLLRRDLPTGWSLFHSLEIDDFSSHLQECHLKTVLRCSNKLFDLVAATEKRSDGMLEEISRLETGNTLIAEFVRLELADRYVTEHRWDEGLSIIKPLSRRGDRQDKIHQICSEMIRRQAKR